MREDWVYLDKVNNREWSFAEIAALYNGNEYMALAVCNVMEGQDPVACRDSLVESGALGPLATVGPLAEKEYVFTDTYYDDEAVLEMYLPLPPAFYSRVTADGYTIIEKFTLPDGQLDVLAAKLSEDGASQYLVASGYSVDEGTCASPEYVSNLVEAVKAWDMALSKDIVAYCEGATLKEEKVKERKPGELKAAGDKPKQPKEEKGSLARDAAAVRVSASVTPESARGSREYQRVK